MRIRSIKPEFFEDEDLAALSPYARLLYIGTWMLADKNGVLENRPRLIQAKVFPFAMGKHPDVSQLFPHLVTAGFLIPFDANGRSYYWIPTFPVHQRITGKEAEGEGRYPLPPADLAKEKQRGNNGETSETHPDAQELGAGSRERKGIEHPLTPTGGASDFDYFWGIYPKRVGKKLCREIWNKLKPPIDDVAAALFWQVNTEQWKKDGGQFIPNPATWLRQGRWMDERPEGTTP